MDSSRSRGIAWCTLAYIVAGAAAVGAGWAVKDWHPLAVIAVADLVGTVVVFAFSRAFDNSSFYDPYWSVAPIAIAAYLLWIADWEAVSVVRAVGVAGLVGAWGARLTFNWIRRWRGLDDEDWRYVKIRKASGGAYWPASFAGIHMVPTLVVYLGCMPLLPALAKGDAPLNVLDAIALVVTGGAILIESIADRQLHRFKAGASKPGQTLTAGLWALCRHPNYLGEVSFWWGLFLFGLAAELSSGWMVVGPLVMTALFVFISIPLIDRRMLERRPDYERRMAEVPALLPRLGTRGR